jgi:hypothetical protein
MWIPNIYYYYYYYYYLLFINSIFLYSHSHQAPSPCEARIMGLGKACHHLTFQKYNPCIHVLGHSKSWLFGAATCSSSQALATLHTSIHKSMHGTCTQTCTLWTPVSFKAGRWNTWDSAKGKVRVYDMAFPIGMPPWSRCAASPNMCVFCPIGVGWWTA